MSCYLYSTQAGCSGVLEVLVDKALCQHRVLFAALLSISLTGLQTLSQKLILLEWMSSFTSPSITAGYKGFLEGNLQLKNWSACGQR